MIIGINGYIGSGKDTIGKIIQYLDDSRNLSLDEWLEPRIYNSYDISRYSMYQLEGRWQIKKFAGKLKEIASILTGIPIEMFEDQEFKKTYLGPEWDTFISTVSPFDSFDTYEERKRMTVREFLQKLGTEGIRDGIHKNAWVNALFADYKFEGCKNTGEACDTPNGNCDSERCYPNWIITDCRFPNEAQAIKERSGIVIRVNRNIIVDGYNLNEGIPKHPSETSLDSYPFDYVINNNGSVNDLVEKVDDMLSHFKLNIKNEVG